MTNIRRKTYCFICGADVTEPLRDFRLRLTRDEPREVAFGDIAAMETGHYGKGVWHLCRECSEVGIKVIADAMEKERK